MNRFQAHSHIGLNGDPCQVCEVLTPPPTETPPQRLIEALAVTVTAIAVLVFLVEVIAIIAFLPVR